jgi:hypothetical protein
VHIDASRRRKLEDKVWKGIFVGYAFDSPAWLIYDPTTRKVVRSRDIIFDESWKAAIPSMVNYDTGSFEQRLPHLSRETVSVDHPIDELEDEHVDVEPSPPSRLEQLELERIVRMAEAPRTRSERTRAAQEESAKNSVSQEDEVALLAVTEPASCRRAMSGAERSQ